MTALDVIQESLVAEAAGDFLGFWEVLWEVRESLGMKTAPSDREQTLLIVRNLLEEGLVEPGFPADQGAEFDSWNVDSKEAMERIEAGWDALGEDPFTGDIVWFIATPKGEQWLGEQRAQRSRLNDPS